MTSYRFRLKLPIINCIYALIKSYKVFIILPVQTATDSAQYIRAVSFLGYVLMEFGMICWIATELQVQVMSLPNHSEPYRVPCSCISIWRIQYFFSLQSEKVGEAILLIEFYNEPVKFQNNIPLIVMRTQRPVHLSAGPFGWLSLELFATVRNTVTSRAKRLTD
jgi:hypothetical protein